ncbi:MAG: GTPase HflX [Alphaproteobacteria bacterium]|nr:GTPase HflX [Alphaproteobacteria bacterium]
MVIEVQQNKKIATCVICPSVAGHNVSLTEENRLNEAVGLALAINLDVVYSETQHMREIKPSTFFSKGFIEKIKPIISENELELMVIDTRISPIQQRNLEKELKLKVIDRTALILEIFGERAQTREGTLQVELAHLTYQRSRLVRSWTHLERQRGGAGFLGGPGETQIELDRRIIDDKIVKIKKELEKVKKTREIQRGARRKVPYPIVALVGYTNAGKSTLFNHLAKSDVMAADMLFATLDPTMRKITLPHGNEIILSDTVGFISDLPHELVMAFRATLEEVLNADIILHIRDIANPDTISQRDDVLQVLDNLGLKNIKYSSNYVEVLNKIDLLDESELISWKNKTLNSKNNVLVSAFDGRGCDELLELIEDKLTSEFIECKVTMSAYDGKIVAWLYDNGKVIGTESEDDIATYTVCLSADNLSRLNKMTADNNRIVIRK